MNYRHSYHAGNFADVLKHAALVAVLLHLRKKQTPFAVIDTHGGRGLYDLKSEHSEKTGEAGQGIVRLLREKTLPGVLEPYREIVREFGQHRYPGSPLIAAKLLRAKDRLVAIEKHPEEFAALSSVMGQIKNARVVHGDGYAGLKRLTPPPERRGVILIDPPFEEEDEFANATRALIGAHRRFATGVYLFWYPAKEKAALAAAMGEILNAGVASLAKIEFDAGGSPERAMDGRRPKLTAAGLLVANPPFGFMEEMWSILPFLSRTLAQGALSHATAETIAGEG